MPRTPRAWNAWGCLAAWLLLMPELSVAQTANGSIAGTVKDATGAVLPGVTVEASSPALIEKVRTVVTDGEGQYKIIELRPGTYTVTFTLPGFNTVKRNDIELTTGFTAAVSAELKIGDISETITVSSQSPVVDIQNTKQHAVMTREVIDTVPTGRMYQTLAVLVPGMTYGLGTGNINQDVGGQSGQSHVALAIHGGRLLDQQLQVDGMGTQHWGRQDASGNMLTNGNFQEYAVDTSGNSAEVEAGGVRVNLIPNEGGNIFKGRFFANFATTGLQNDNVTDALRQRGLRDPNRVKTLWEVNPALGGPVKQDRLWFFGTYTSLRTDIWAAGTYFSKDPAAWVYNPDVTRQAAEEQRTRDGAVRLTWQATPRNKFATYLNYDSYCQCYYQVGRGKTPEATPRLIGPQKIYQATWASPVTNRLLLEAGASSSPQPQWFNFQSVAVAPPITDQGLGVNLRSNIFTKFICEGSVAAEGCHSSDFFRGSVSYVTGSHALKLGFTLARGKYGSLNDSIGHVSFTTVNGVPTSVTYRGDPVAAAYYGRNLGIYAQDQWTLKRLTANAGVRFDSFRSGYPAHDIPPTQYVPGARVIPGLEATNWRDLSPRLGVSYDLLGNGKTALKVSVNRYVLQQATSLAAAINPIANNNTNTRRWTDSDGDYIIQGDPFNPAANGELGPSTNLNFGKPIITSTYDPKWASGFGLRPYNWEVSAGIQRELIPRVSVNASYFRRIYGNFAVTENIAVTASDYSPYCVTAPVDPRLPDGRGYPVCGLFDLNPGKVGQSFSFGTAAGNYGDQFDHWNGVDLAVNARLPRLLLQGGLSTGRTMQDTCAIATKYPNVVATTIGPTGAALPSGPSVSTQFCRTETPFLTQTKLLASFTLPWEVQIAGTYQNLPGPQIAADAVFTSAQVASSLGRALASASTVTVNIVKPGTLYGERMQQVDLRFTKIVKVGRMRLQGMVDIYNILNGSPVLAVNNTYGVTTGAAAGAPWQVPQGILPPRLLKFGVQLDF